MGFDVTFHPVDKQDLKHFLFDVVEDNSLADSRAAELATDEEKRKMVMLIYSQFPEWLRDMETFDDSLFRTRETMGWKIRAALHRYPRRYYEIGPTFAYAAAAIAGFRHPYWYSRGSALSFLIQYAPILKFIFIPLPRLFPGKLSKVTDASGGRIIENYCGSGYIEAQRLQFLERYLQSLEIRRVPGGKSVIYQVFDDDNIHALMAAVTYAKDRQLGLMEASDIVVPIADQFASDPDNLRASFLEGGRLKGQDSGRSD